MRTSSACSSAAAVRPGSGSSTARRSRRLARSSPASRRRSCTAGCSARVSHRSRPPGAAEAFRYGRAGMQIHFALSEPPVWASSEASRLSRTAIVHVTPGLDGVSRAVNEAERGLLPAEATIVVGQPCAVDPGRAPDGSWILWIQLQELPRVPRGDALGLIDVGDGTLDGRAPRGLRRPHHRAARATDQQPRASNAQAGGALAGRPRGAELQPRRRRHLRGLVRARPEPAVAPERRPARACDRDRRALADRRLDASGAGTRPGLGLSHREAADPSRSCTGAWSIASRSPLGKLRERLPL